MHSGRAPVAKGPSVWLLAAVSAEGQSETLPHQRAWGEEVASMRGWRLSRIIEGVATGKAGPRRIVHDLLSDIRALDAEARPTRLLMIRADRLGRGSIVESQIVLRDLHDLGVSVFTRDQGEVKLDSAMDELISAATLAVARHENDVRRDKMREVRRRKREAGEPMGKAPYGLRYKNNKCLIDGERAPVVREAFKLRLQGKGLETIARRLTAIAPPHLYVNGNSRVVNWTPTRVRKLLLNRAYIGPIVDEATFARAQKAAALLANDRKHDRRRRYPWPLAGSLRCYCGRGMLGLACGIEPWRYRYYACRARWNHDDRLRLVRADKLEEQFVALLGRLRASPKLIERHRRRSLTSPQLLERTLKDQKARLDELARKRGVAWELHAAGKVRAEDVQERLDALNRERGEIQDRIVAVQQELAIAKAATSQQRDAEALIRRGAQIFRRANVEEQNKIARAVSVELGGLHVDTDQKLKPGAAA
ncbi:MAG TPA: recombinase family protein [Candidatus Binatia bacterium]|nr:recombinase family protein [Candidatus Binatia bacterium]